MQGDTSPVVSTTARAELFPAANQSQAQSMCGICGVFEYRDRRPVDRDVLEVMNQTMVHRGPDDQGVFVRPGIGLAMRRLSIIDLAGGHQPIANEDETVWVILNGEIYNFRQLRETLERRGHRFRTHSDTEVIVHLYEEHGPECVKLLDGMFALALYDARTPAEPRLLIARDPFGKKPLYYADLGETIVFGSELKAVMCDARVSRELDFDALHHYLSLFMVPAPLSIFRAVKKLEAGHLLECDRAGVRTRPYWRHLDWVTEREVSYDEAKREVRKRLFAAVEKRLVSDVPLGAFLSGGLDSSAVVAIMSELKSDPVRTFSIGFEGPATHNELPYAKQLAEHWNTDHHEVIAKPEIVELLPDLVRFADEPFAISSAIPTYLLSKAVRKEVTVVLTGDGGDELFGGYGHYLYERWARGYRRLPRSADRALLAAAGLLHGPVTNRVGKLRGQVQRFVRNARLDASERRLGWASGFGEAEKAALYGARLKRRPSQSTSEFLARRIAGIRGDWAGERISNELDVLVWLPDEMLVKVDRMTMGASLEARSPLLDRELAEYAAGLPFSMKLQGFREGGLKRLLRDTVSDLLPPALRRPRKWGFNVPLDSWFRGPARPYVEDRLSRARVTNVGVFDPDVVRGLLDQHQHGAANLSGRIFALLVFHEWATAARSA